MDWPELRLRLQLRLFQAWPFRLVSWWLERRVPQEQGFGPFRPDGGRPVPPLTPGQLAFHGELTANQPAFSLNAALARACIADAERLENSIGTRIDAAINAMALLDHTALFDADVKQYLHLKYYRAMTDDELTFYWRLTLGMARELLSNSEKK